MSKKTSNLIFDKAMNAIYDAEKAPGNVGFCAETYTYEGGMVRLDLVEMNFDVFGMKEVERMADLFGDLEKRLRAVIGGAA